MTTWIVVVIVVILLALLLVSAAVLFRLVVVRGNGSAALMRSEDSGKWRYGSLHYSSSALGYYRLLSLRPSADVIMPRALITLGGWRRPSEDELDVLDPDEIILPVAGPDQHGHELDFDLCLGRREATALLSWVEARSTEDVRVRRSGTSKRRRP